MKKTSIYQLVSWPRGGILTFMRSIFYPLLLLGLGMGQYFAEAKLSGSEVGWVTPPRMAIKPYQPIVYELITMGNYTTAADWFWMKGLQDPAYSKVARGVRIPSYYDFDLSTDLDPAYITVYHFGASLGSIIRDDHVGAVALLAKSKIFRLNDLSSWPKYSRNKYWVDEWLLPFTAGFIYLAFLDDQPKGIESLEDAKKTGVKNSTARKLLNRLEKPSGKYDIALRFARSFERTSSNPLEKEFYRKRADTIFLEQYLFEMNLNFQIWLKGNINLDGKTKVGLWRIKREWERFIWTKGLKNVDPRGGKLYIDKSGRIETMTKYERIFPIVKTTGQLPGITGKSGE